MSRRVPPSVSFFALLIALAPVAEASSLPAARVAERTSASAAGDRRGSASAAAMTNAVGGDLRERVLVLPLAAPAESEPEWLSAGIAEFLSESFRATAQAVVDREERDAVLEDAGLADEQRLTLASACLLAREAGARRVVTGTWSSSGNVVSIRARIIDVRRLKLLREASAEGAVDGLGAMLGKVALELTGSQGDPKRRVEDLARVPQPALIAWMQAASEPEGAEQHLEAALQAAPGFVAARLALAEARLDAGQPEDASRLLAVLTATSLPPHETARARLLEGRALLASGDAKRAATVLAEAARLVPDRESLLWLAEAQLAASDRAGAAGSARRLLELQPDDARAHEILERAEGPDADPPEGGS